MKYVVQTSFDGFIEWSGEAENEEQAGKFAEDAIFAMDAEEYARCSTFTGQEVKPQGPLVPECPRCNGPHATYEAMDQCIEEGNREAVWKGERK
ncbi:MAG: hypothetical protein ABSA33_06040 [Candidatus Micrarchaeaceae archaeon]|jgi:hypothetical protein